MGWIGQRLLRSTMMVEVRVVEATKPRSAARKERAGLAWKGLPDKGEGEAEVMGVVMAQGSDGSEVRGSGGPLDTKASAGPVPC